MRALFAQPAFVKHQNAIGVLNRAQAMRDHHRRAPFSSRSSASRIRSSVFVSTLEVASSRIRNFGSCASARAKLTSCRCPTERVAPRSVTGVSTPCGQRIEKRPKAHFAQSAFRARRESMLFRAELHVRFQRAGEKERVLQHDAEQSAADPADPVREYSRRRAESRRAAYRRNRSRS